MIRENILNLYRYGQETKDSKTVEKGKAEEVDESVIKDEELLKSELSEEDAFDVLEKSLDVSRLRRVRQTVVRHNGTVYQKTFYRKKEEIADPSIAIPFAAQNDIETMGNRAIGRMVTAKWKGEVSGTQYESSNFKVKEINDNNVILEFTAPFQTGNSSNYTYSVGTTISLPRTSSESWDQSRSIQSIQPLPTTTTTTAAPRITVEPISSFSELSVGDTITITENGESREVVVRRLNHNNINGYDFFGYVGEDGAIKMTKFGKRGVVLTKKVENQAPQDLNTKFSELISEGYNVTLPSSSTVPSVSRRVLDGTEEYTARVRIDRFGHENARGRSYGNVTRTRNRYRDLSDEEYNTRVAEANSGALSGINGHAHAEKLRNFDFKTLTNEFIDTFAGEGVTLNKRDVLFQVTRSAMTLSVRKNGVEMERTFKFDEENVYHALFRMDSDRQGGSLGKKLFKSLYKHYKAIGTKSIRVSANIDVGCYAWAAFGFSTNKSNAESLIGLVEREAERGVSHTVKERDANGVMQTTVYTPTMEDARRMRMAFNNHYQHNSHSESIPVRNIASVAKKAAKASWIGNRRGWPGTIDLTKDSERVYFENYIGFNS